MNIITALLSRVIGLPEPTLRLLSTILLAYPSAFYYKKLYLSQDSLKSTREDRNQYILFAGLALSFFFNGFHIYHSLVTTAVSYGLCFMFGEQMNDRKLALMTVWGFNALYLLVGYYYMQTDDYDITWTMSQCILCLRMMGFGFDYYDGRKKFTVASAPTEKQANKNEDHTQAAIRGTEKAKPPPVLPLSFRADTPLTDLPDLKEVFAYAHFPAAFLVGPQFSFSLYRKWLNDDERQLNAEEHEEKERAQVAYIIRCVLLAAVYLGLQQTIGTRYNTSYLLTDEYRSLCLLKRAFVFVVAGKFAYNKYIGIWLLTEGKKKTCDQECMWGFGVSHIKKIQVQSPPLAFHMKDLTWPDSLSSVDWPIRSLARLKQPHQSIISSAHSTSTRTFGPNTTSLNDSSSSAANSRHNLVHWHSWPSGTDSTGCIS